MKRSILEDYHLKERAISEKLFADHTARLQESDSETLSYLDFFPELQSQLKNKVWTNWMIDSKSIFVQLPFYDTVILPLKPFPDETTFQKNVWN